MSIYEVRIQHDCGLVETFGTTEEHPFYVCGIGWQKASVLEAGMTLLDKQGNPTAKVISQHLKDTIDTVYNFEVQDFHTYHIGELGIWVHNHDCCIIGRDGGRAVYTNINDTNGNAIYERVNAEGKGQGTYYIVDSNGKQQRMDSPRERPVANNTGYYRPPLRKGTIAEIEANYIKQPNGDYYDPANDIVIKGPIDIGHAYGWEHRRLELAAQELNMTQQQFNDYVNARPEHFRLENMSRNRSHYDEMPGKDDIERVKQDMQKFLNGE